MKPVIFGFTAILLSALTGILIVEIGIRFTDRSPVKSTWLEMHERGFMMNRPDMDALHTFKDIRVRYHLSPQRTRGSEVDPADTNIWVFGDSFAFGLMLEKEDTFTSRLNRFVQDRHPESGIRFVNAGVGGTGLADWVAFLETFGDAYPIDGILFLHNYDDFERMIAKNLYILDDMELIPSKRWEETALKQRMDSSGSWKWIQERSRLASWIQTLLWNTSYFDDVTAVSQSAYPLPPSYSSEAEFFDYSTALAGRLYQKTTELADDMGVPFWVSTTGFIDESVSNPLNMYVFSHAAELLEDASVYYDDITPQLTELIDGDYDRIRIPDDTHPDPEGASMIARLLWNGVGTEITSFFITEG